MAPSESQPRDARAAILARIATAATEAGRDPGAVGLTAVSKQQPWDAIRAILASGQRTFGENRVQEAVGRWRDRHEGLELRLIGPLQTNKAREAVGFFDVIESLDRPRLAEAIAREAERLGGAPRLYVQVNTGEEPQKAGIWPERTDAFVDALRHDYGLEPEGLMCIPPQGEPPAPHFALLARLARRNGLAGLSMGMSADFETAIRFGATSVRIGTALFGQRISHAGHAGQR